MIPGAGWKWHEARALRVQLDSEGSSRIPIPCAGDRRNASSGAARSRTDGPHEPQVSLEVDDNSTFRARLALRALERLRSKPSSHGFSLTDWILQRTKCSLCFGQALARGGRRRVERKSKCHRALDAPCHFASKRAHASMARSGRIPRDVLLLSLRRAAPSPPTCAVRYRADRVCHFAACGRAVASPNLAGCARRWFGCYP